MVAGRYLASAVSKHTLKQQVSPNRTAEQIHSSHALEAFMSSVMDTYYAQWASDLGHVPLSSVFLGEGIRSVPVQDGAASV